MQLGGFKTDFNMKKKYHETEFGKVPESVKKVALSKKTIDILNGINDNDYIDPNNQPVLAKINAKIKAKQIINWSEMSRLLALDRSAITKDRIPQKHSAKLNELIDFIADWLIRHNVGK